MIIDATNLILGRFAGFAAKQALLGEEISVINCEKAVITGDKNLIVEDYRAKIRRGVPDRGPHFPRNEEAIVRRTIRGMLPKKKSRGREAYKNVMCYLGTPESLKNEKFVTLKFNIDKLTTLKYLQLKEISRIIGGKQNDL